MGANHFLKQTSFFEVLFPILVAFLGFRIMLQTDLIMLAPLGEVAVAAFGVPMRVMWIDTVFVLAMVPIAGIYVSGVKDQEKTTAITRMLSLGFYTSMMLVPVCFFVYPFLVNYFVTDPAVATLSWEAVFWLTLSIPVRFNVALNQMLLFSLNKGREVNLINLVALLLNGILDWLCIYQWQMGFQGAYVSTIFISSMQCVWGMWRMRQYAPIKNIFRWHSDFGQIFGMMSAELIRLVALNLMWFTSLILFTSSLSDVNHLSAYSAYTEFYGFLSMGLIASMRAVGLILAAQTDIHLRERYRFISQIGLKGLPFIILISLLLGLTGTQIGGYLYRLEGIALNWWEAAIWVYLFILPLYYWNALQRGAWQSVKAFHMLSITEIIFYWIVFIPSVYISLTYENAFLPWLGMALAEFLIGIFLWGRYKYTSITQKKFEMRGLPASNPPRKFRSEEVRDDRIANSDSNTH